MKKVNYVTLHLILAMILITMGGLMVFKGRDVSASSGHMLFIVPGITILSGIFLEWFKFKKHIIYIIAYLLVYLILDIAVIVTFKVNFTTKIGLIAAGLMVLSVLIASVFHFIYDNLKHPKRLFRF